MKEAVRQTRAERQRQLEEQQTLRALTALPDNDGDYTPTPGDERPTSTGGNLSDANVAPVDGADPGTRTSPVFASRRVEPSSVPARKKERQPAQFSGRAICAYEKSILGVLSLEGGDLDGGGREKVASRQSKEISFLQELSAIESQERDREFKVWPAMVGRGGAIRPTDLGNVHVYYER